MSEQPWSVWLSMGLFVATALASQVVQNVSMRRNKREEEAQNVSMRAKRREQETYDSQAFAEDLPRAGNHRYYMKRLSQELSYEEMDFALGSSEDDGAKSQVAANMQSGDDVYDFQPKNNNWSHFETEDNEEESDENDDNSSSSEEAFLWTSSTRIRRGRNPILSNFEEKPTWTSKLKEAAPVAWAVQRGMEAAGRNDSSHHKEPDREDTATKWRRIQPRRRSLPRQNSAPIPSEHRSIPQVQNRVARAKYNARIMPNKVVMLRHGQSVGNMNENLYSTTPDNAMPLTELGWEQARRQGKVLKEQVLASGESVHFIVSPYVRTVETFHGVVSAWCDPSEFSHIVDRDKRLKAWYGRLLELGLTWHEDPRIREQDFGNYQDPEKIKKSKKERHGFGTFFYRFAHGESAADVFDRVSTFLDSLWRSFYLNRARNYVIITHGISIRVVLARYFRYTIDQFSMMANPKNCEMVVLRHDGAGRLQLEGRWEQEVTEEGGEKHVTGCTFHKCLRVLPSEWVRKTNIRISYDDGLE